MSAISGDGDLRDQLFAAAQHGDREQVTRLLAAQPTLASARNADGVSATLYSLYSGEPEIAALLADSGAEMTIFETAALGRVDALRDLLTANPERANAVSADGFTPLGLASFFGQLESVQVLLDHGADPNSASRNAMRVALLHSAVAGRHLDIAEALLRHGAQVNAAQADDFTPLHGAAQNGQTEMIALLLAHGADLTARTSDGQTPLDVAQAAGQEGAAALLRERMDGGAG